MRSHGGSRGRFLLDRRFKPVMSAASLSKSDSWHKARFDLDNLEDTNLEH